MDYKMSPTGQYLSQMEYTPNPKIAELLKKPIKIKFLCDSDKSEHIVEAVVENGEIVIDFDGKWYRTTDDLFGKAEIAGDRLVTLGYSVHDFEVI